MELLSLFPDQLSGLFSLLPALLSLGNLVFGSTLATVTVAAIFYFVYTDTGKNFKATLTVVAHVVVPWMLLAGVIKLVDAIIMRPYTHGIALCFIALVAAVWFLLPFYWLLRHFSDVPRRVKAKAMISFVKSYFRGLAVLPFSVSAWLVLPIILLFVKKEDNTLPGILETLYGSVDGLHGDNTWWVVTLVSGESMRLPCPTDPTQKLLQPDGSYKPVIDFNYWLPGVFQRTFSSRLVWLTRKRCTKLKTAFGKQITDYENYEYFGSKKPIGSDSGEGWYLMLHNNDVDLTGFAYLGKLFGKYPMCGRVRCGFKLSNVMSPFVTSDIKTRSKRVEVVNTSFSVKVYRGPIE